MSIIYDALKKSGDNNEDNNNKQELSQDNQDNTVPASAGTAQQEPEKKVESKKHPLAVKLTAVFILIACMAFFVYSIGSSTDSLKIMKSNASRKFSTAKKKKKRAKKNKIPKSAPAPQPDATGFALHGIIYSPTDPIALLNNDSYRKGETVNGAKIISIQEHYVILEKDGSKIKVNLQD